MKIAINGSGRIGLCVARIAGSRNDIQISAINTLSSIDMVVHLIKHDSMHSINYEVKKINEDTIQIGNSKNVKIFQEKDPSKIPFGSTGAQVVIEATGVFATAQKSKPHLKDGINKVIISAPADSKDPTFVYGVNHHKYNQESIISNASCTTNCLAPIVKILHDEFGIESGLMSTIHSYTNDQNLLDSEHAKGDLRRARAAALNMIPTSTGAAKAISLVMPELAGKLNGMAIRVPTPDVSCTDLSVLLKKDVSVEDINDAIKQVADGALKGIVGIDNDQRVSMDFVGSSYSAIFVPDKTLVVENKHAKVFMWYDNEVGYSNRLIDMALFINK